MPKYEFDKKEESKVKEPAAPAPEVKKTMPKTEKTKDSLDDDEFYVILDDLMKGNS
ncbi:hypothetical protein SDC9_185692 [bioreactor metagenome]|uniref:Uncharacterized protein n=1 Tax=bioreactor metagenome TaxID=1076179 RepID=A0A645HGJ7_9ZZZZ